MHTHFLTPKTRQRGHIEPALHAGWFTVTAPAHAWPDLSALSRPTCFMVQLHTQARAATAKEKAQLRRMKVAQI